MFESLKGGLLPGSVTQSSLQAQGNTNLETYCLHAPSAEELTTSKGRRFSRRDKTKCLSFLKETACLPLLTEKSSENTVPPNLGNNSWADNSHRTLSPDLFSHGMVRCVLGLSLHSSETAANHVFVNLGIRI